VRFTIRDLILGTAIVGLGVAWWIEHSQHVDCQQALHSTSEAHSMLLDLVHSAGFTIGVDGKGQYWLLNSDGEQLGPAKQTSAPETSQ
jgi:hypothetical protein